MATTTLDKPPKQKAMSAVELVAYLKESGTGVSRIESLEEFCTSNKGASAAECLEWMIGQNWAEQHRGTVLKAGERIYGSGFTIGGTGVSQSDEMVAKVDTLKEELKQTKEQNVKLAAQVRNLQAENANLRRGVDRSRLEASGDRTESVKSNGRKRVSGRFAKETAEQEEIADALTSTPDDEDEPI